MASERYYFRLDHDFADDCLFLRVADLVDTTVELCQAVYIRLLTKASKNGDGSVGGVDLDEVAWYYRKPVELIERIVETFRRLGKLDGDRLVNWTKRQGSATIVKLAETAKGVGHQVRAVSTPRTRKHRAARQAAERQLSLLLPIGGAAAPGSGIPGTPVPEPSGTPAETLKSDGVSAPSTATGNTPEKEKESERSLETESFYSNAVPLKGDLNDSKNREEVSRRTAPLDAETSAIQRNKRLNMIKTLRRWVLSSPHQTEDDKADYLAMLGRAEYALDDWGSRTLADKHWLDELKRKADRLPLDVQTVTFHRMVDHGGVYRSKRFWAMAMAQTEATHAAHGMPDMPFDTGVSTA